MAHENFGIKIITRHLLWPLIEATDHRVVCKDEAVSTSGAMTEEDEHEQVECQVQPRKLSPDEISQLEFESVS